MRVSIFIFLAIVIALPFGGECLAVERESVVESDVERFEKSHVRTGLGFEAESRLKTEASGKSFFFLTNEIPWPEKQVIPPPPPRPTPRPSPQKVKEPREESAEDEEVGPNASPQRAVPDSAAAKSSGATGRLSVAADNTRPAPETKKNKPAKKPAVALPDIERLLADVRRSAQPRMSMEVPASKPREIVSSAPMPVAEVEQSVDMDALVRDLEKLQKGDPQRADKPAQIGQPAKGPAWWVVFFGASGGAGILFLAMRYIRTRRQSPIRTQSQIDAETRAFFSRLMKEQSRRAAKVKSPSPQAPAAPSPAAHAPTELPEAELAEVFEPEEPQSPAVFLLPPDLAQEAAYKEVVKLAAMGENPHGISEKLNLGEGEVRLVLDIARLSRDRLQTA